MSNLGEYFIFDSYKKKQVESISEIRDFIESRAARSEMVYIVDIDDTLRDTSQRKQLLPSLEEIKLAGEKPNKAFELFNQAGGGDLIIQPMHTLVRRLSFDSNSHVIFLTSCTYSEESLKTILYQFGGIQNCYLVMRGEDEQKFPVDFKEAFVKDTEIYDQGINQYVMAIDDCQKNCTMFNLYGVQTLKFTK